MVLRVPKTGIEKMIKSIKCQLQSIVAIRKIFYLKKKTIGQDSSKVSIRIGMLTFNTYAYRKSKFKFVISFMHYNGSTYSFLNYKKFLLFSNKYKTTNNEEKKEDISYSDYITTSSRCLPVSTFR